MSEETQQEVFLKNLDDIIRKTFVTGQLIVVATKQHGKTNASFWLLRRIMESQMHKENVIKTMIFDPILRHRYGFDSVPYIDITKTRMLPMVQDLIVDVPFIDSHQTRNAITNVLMQDFIRKRKIKEDFEGKLPFINFYLVEEMQDVWGTHSLSGNQGRFAKTIFSQCKNLDMVIFGTTQRLADVSAKIVERTRYYLIGALTGDNDGKKIASISNKNVVEEVKALKRGEFLFLDRENPETFLIIYFPVFKQNGKPYAYQVKGNGQGYVRKILRG